MRKFIELQTGPLCIYWIFQVANNVLSIDKRIAIHENSNDDSQLKRSHRFWIHSKIIVSPWQHQTMAISFPRLVLMSKFLLQIDGITPSEYRSALSIRNIVVKAFFKQISTLVDRRSKMINIITQTMFLPLVPPQSFCSDYLTIDVVESVGLKSTKTFNLTPKERWTTIFMFIKIQSISSHKGRFQ